MKYSFIIAMRECKERIFSRSYLLFSIFGPLIVLVAMYILFVVGGHQTEHWNVLVADKSNILNKRMLAHPDSSVSYSFADNYIQHTDFAQGKRYQEYDALVEINEKVLSNKVSHVFYRIKPSPNLQAKVQYHVERRLEEVMVERFTDLKVEKFREIKQAIHFSFRNVYDPYDQTSDIRTWVGFVLGMIILIFIALFGMTILRSISFDKSNRIVELLLCCVRSEQLMFGKIMGVGWAAFIQFTIWIAIVSMGLFLMREWIFPNMYDAASLNFAQLDDSGRILSLQEKLYNGHAFNAIVDLVYERTRFAVLLPFFALFFIGGYLFYGSFFAAIGATAGTENDGQQFIIPILLILVMSVYAGYYTTQHPESVVATWLHFLPFSSPIVVMTRLAYGYEAGTSYQIWLSLSILLLAAWCCLWIAARLYRNGVLQFGHRLKLKQFIRWSMRS